MQAMDKTSKLFLESEIKRILNLNERIESKDFILENVTPELQKSLDDVIAVIVQILSAKKSNDMGKVKPFINDILYDNMLNTDPKKYCGGRGMVQCKDLVDFFKYRVENAGDFTGLSGATNAYNAFKKDLDTLNGDSVKLKERIKSESGKEVKLNPYTLTDDEIEDHLGQLEGVLSGLESRGLEVNFDSLNTIKDKLKNGTICAEGKKTYCETEQEVKDSLETQLTSIRGMVKQLQKTLSPQEISDKLDLFDRKLSPTLVKNQGEEWADKMRKSFSSMMQNGSICPSCETKDEVLDAVNREMAEMKKYSVSGEKEAVEKMANFLERAGKAHQIYKDFMDMWGLSDSDFGNSISKGTKNKDGDYTFKEGDRVEIKVEYGRGDDRKEIFNVFTGSDNFTNSWLSGVFKKRPIGDYDYWFVSKKNGRETVAIGLPIKTPVIEKGKQYNVVFQKLKSKEDYGKGEKVLNHSTPVKIQVK